jgi:uncharacterized membrane protein YqgA involved in biofilm formation
MATAIGTGPVASGLTGEKVMNATNVLAKVVVCGLAAVALTAASGWAIVHSTAKAYWPEDMPTVVILAKAERPATVQLARSAAAGLLQ